MRSGSSIVLVALLGCGPCLAQDTVRVQMHGMVADATTGAPLVEALVEWIDDKDHRQAVTQTNIDGHYALFVRTTGMLVLRVEEGRYAVLRDTVRGFAPGQSAREHDLFVVPR